MDWGATFLKLKAPIVLFTEESMVDEILKLRENRPIQIITIPFTELDTWKLYKDKWVQNHQIDPENRYHTPELYAIWAQKPFFVEKAIEINPFKTDYFFWMDFGAMRDPNIDQRVLNNFPHTDYFMNDKILLQSMGNLKESDKKRGKDGICGEKISNRWNELRLVGGLWGGSAKACLRWKQEYQTMLEKYFEKNRFAGKDQIVMLSTYLENPKLAIIVEPTLQGIDQWFFLQYLLAFKTAKGLFKLNTTYIL
jgi:hypothetical protein